MGSLAAAEKGEHAGTGDRGEEDDTEQRPAAVDLLHRQIVLGLFDLPRQREETRARRYEAAGGEQNGKELQDFDCHAFFGLRSSANSQQCSWTRANSPLSDPSSDLHHRTKSQKLPLDRLPWARGVVETTRAVAPLAPRRSAEVQPFVPLDVKNI
jgi:hypothetical protein